MANFFKDYHKERLERKEEERLRKIQEELRTYKAEYEDDEIEVFSYCSTDDEALDEAFSFEDEHGALFNLFELDSDYNEIRTVF